MFFFLFFFFLFQRTIINGTVQPVASLTTVASAAALALTAALIATSKCDADPAAPELSALAVSSSATSLARDLRSALSSSLVSARASLSPLIWRSASPPTPAPALFVLVLLLPALGDIIIICAVVDWPSAFCDGVLGAA